jgi:tetratricopeptide (TPR) repeat protein
MNIEGRSKMKKQWLIRLLLFLLCLTPFMALAQQNEEDTYDPSIMLDKIKINYDKKNYSTIYHTLLDAIRKHPMKLSWFYYAIFSESAYKIGATGNLESVLPNNFNMKVLARSMREWSLGNTEKAAYLLSSIQSQSPCIAYLVGKMFYSQGKVVEGSAYFSLGAAMQEAPFGQYYYGLSLLGSGRFSSAISAFKEAIDMSDEKLQPHFVFDAKLQLARSYFGDESYSSAYDLAMDLFEQNPSKVIDVVDPGLALTAMKKNQEAREFWQKALKMNISSKARASIKKKLNYNKRLVDPNYPQN